VGDLDVTHCRKGGQQIETLEDEADLGAASAGAFSVGEGGEVNAVDEDGASGGSGESAEDIEECGFAGTGGADNSDELAGCNGKVDLAKSGYLELAGAIGLAKIAGEDDGRCGIAIGPRVKRRCGGEVGLGGQRGRMRRHVRIESLSRMGWRVRPTELLLVGVAGWTALGMVGVGVSWLRGERLRIRRGIAWLAGVWVVYLAVLIGVSLGQKQRVVPIGQPQCFDEMCFTVTGVEEIKGFLVRDGRRLVRVTVRVTNHGRSAGSDGLIRVYLTDAQGRRWEESAGVNGVGLSTKVAGGDSVMSEPVFKVAGDATGLRLVLTHGWKQPGVLVIGDSDSMLHREAVVELGR
jgi:hypothetical protein